MKLDPIEREFAAKGLIRGGVLLLEPEEALNMVRRCRAMKIRVLGLDGFVVTDKTTQPSMEHSVDLSKEQKDTSTCWDEAEGFLRSRLNSGMFFEVVVASGEGDRTPRLPPLSDN